MKEPQIGDTMTRTNYVSPEELREGKTAEPYTLTMIGWSLMVPKYNKPGSSFSVRYGDLYTDKLQADDAAAELKAESHYLWVCTEPVWSADA